MPALFIYLIKVNVALLIFCLGYYAVLRHLTFYTLNRIYLVTAIVFSTLYPKVDLTAFLNRHEQIQVVVVNWQEPVKVITQSTVYDVWYWMQVVFWTGVILFTMRLLTQLLSLYRLHKQSEPAQIRHYMIRVIHGNINPFSFWRSIYINPANHSPNELDAILEHEQIHVKEWHTLDILLSEVSAIFYWFNPGIWLMKRAIRENIEFITDRKILQKGVDSKAYQYSLLNVNFGAQSNAVVNHFNISTIKKRIIMMNAKRSSSVNITRYIFLIPVVMVLLLVFSVSKAELTRGVTKSSAGVMRVFKAVVTKINFTQEKTAVPERKKTPELSIINRLTIQADTPRFNGKLLADTNKKVSISIRGVNDPDIFIDGEKVNTGINMIDPNTIEQISIVKDAKATSPNGTIYIITKKRNGDLLSHKIGTDTITNKLHGKVDHILITTTVQDANASGTASPMNEVTVVGYGSQAVAATADSKRITKIRINGKDLTDTSTFATPVTLLNAGALIGKLSSGDVKSVTLNKDSSIRIVTGRVTTATTTGHGTANRTFFTNFTTSYSTTAPISFTDKVIVIDGKEASAREMKKLSADKIESINNLQPGSAITKYGNKAKNGAIIIITKK